jgi:protease II
MQQHRWESTAEVRCWLIDSSTIMQVFRASIDAVSEPVCVFEESDERYNVSISKSADKKLMWINSAASMQNELLYVTSTAPSEPFKVRVVTTKSRSMLVLGLT